MIYAIIFFVIYILWFIIAVAITADEKVHKIDPGICIDPGLFEGHSSDVHVTVNNTIEQHADQVSHDSWTKDFVSGTFNDIANTALGGDYFDMKL